MQGWIVWVIVGVVIVVAAVVGQRLGIMNFKTDKNWRKTSGNVLGPLDSIFAPNRAEAMQEFERQTELPARAPSPGDGDRDVYKGSIKIDLSKDQ